MAGIVKRRWTSGARKSERATEESPLTKWTLVGIALAFCAVFLLLPLANVFYQALSKGWTHYWGALSNPNSIAAIELTAIVALITVPLNVLFGLAAAWAITKFDFKGKPFLTTLIDLPFAVSPVVAGLVFVVLFGLQGYWGEWLDARDIKIIFAIPGIVLATIFVTLPFVARELIPLMQAQGSDQEQAALTLGASGWQTFVRITLPNIKWGLLFGIILCNSRAMGEFGAVSVVSGHIEGKTDTMPLRVDKLYNEYDATAAFAIASLLALLALFTLVLKVFLEWKQRRELELAQEVAGPEEPVLRLDS